MTRCSIQYKILLLLLRSENLLRALKNLVPTISYNMLFRKYVI